jgi:hypothetical protein
VAADPGVDPVGVQGLEKVRNESGLPAALRSVERNRC